MTSKFDDGETDELIELQITATENMFKTKVDVDAFLSFELGSTSPLRIDDSVLSKVEKIDSVIENAAQDIAKIYYLMYLIPLKAMHNIYRKRTLGSVVVNCLGCPIVGGLFIMIGCTATMFYHKDDAIRYCESKYKNPTWCQINTSYSLLKYLGKHRNL